MAKKKTVYICSVCSHEHYKLQGKCNGCNEWNTLVESSPVNDSVHNKKSIKHISNTKRLSEVAVKNDDRIVTSMNEFNRVMGGGIVRDSLSIITAVPGAGKSTLLLQISQDIAEQGLKVLYASGEESESQIRRRADRILPNLHDDIYIYSDNNLNEVLGYIENVDPDFIVIDSIQTFLLEEYPSRPGSPTQTMECANALLKVAKNSHKPRAIIIVGQMTKDNELAGLRALEHLVDTVLILEGEEGEELKNCVCSKNRFGNTWEMAFFTMTSNGLISIDNPSEYFMTQRSEEALVPGSALAVVKEGTRPIILEIESLVSLSLSAYPSRIAECMKRDQINILTSILEQRAGIELFNKNVVIKTTGGLKLKEQSSNLAVIMSIVSSAKDEGIKNDTVFIADVGLTGELKKVPSLDIRIKEAERMGFKKVYIADGALKSNTNFPNIEILPCRTLRDVINSVFNKKTRNHN